MFCALFRSIRCHCHSGSDSALASKLQRELSTLESKLHSLALLGAGSKTGASGSSGASNPELEVSPIKCVADEVDYWTAVAETGGHAGARASLFLEKLSSPECPLAQKWDGGSLGASGSSEEVSRILEDTQYALSEVWLAQPDRGDPYPQVRMEHLMHLLSLALVAHVKSSLKSSISLWTDPYPKVKESLQVNLGLLNQWQLICDELIANEFGSKWHKAPVAAASAASSGSTTAGKHAYHEPALRSLLDRLDELLRLRSLHEELLHLLSPEDAHTFKLHSFFDVLARGGGGAGAAPIDPYNVGPYALPKWLSARAELDKLLLPVETHAATQLKNRLYALADKPELLMQEFTQFAALLRRPNVALALENERKTLLQQLSTRLEELKQNFEGYSNEYAASRAAPPALKNQPSPFLARIVWANQLSHRLQQILAIVGSVLGGIPGQERFHSLASDLRRRIEAYAKELFDRWHEDVRAALSDPHSSLKLETTGKLMDLDLGGTGELVIHYSEALVTLLREVRQLQEYGYKLSDPVLSAVATGESYYKYGLKLKSVANFYNTIRDKIIPSQMGLLLLEAQRFEKVIKEQKGTTRWNNTEECERYMERLMHVTEELTTRNTKLKSMHLALASQVSALFNPPYDLAKGKDAFLDSVSRVRAVIDKEAARGSSTREAIALWRAHWNAQIYKALNFQYAWLLETINGDGSNGGNGSGNGGSSQSVSLGGGGGGSSAGSVPSIILPSFADIPVELKFQHKRLTLRPALEDLRSSYYRNLRKFIDLPKTFQGCYEAAPGSGLPGAPSLQASIFASIPERNAAGLHSIYQQAEALFESLSATLRRYEPWMVLGTVDLESYTSERLVTVLDYEVNFRALKARKKESEKLPDSVRIGCFLVSFASFKASLDDLMHKFHEALLLSLKRSTTAALKTLSEFLQDALQTLTASPQSVAEMTRAKEGFDRIASSKPAMQSLMDQMVEKDCLLKLMANVSLDLSAIGPSWALFLDSYAQFDDLLLEQKETLRAGLENQIKEAKLASDKLASRWASTKPSAESDNLTAAAATKIIEELSDWTTQLKAAREAQQELQASCESFNMPTPQFEVLDALEKEVQSYADSWGLFTEYAAEVDRMTKEDWVAFRKEISSFAALLDRWTNKLKQRGQRDAVFDYLAKEIKTNRDVYPVLQLISADFLQNEHFKMLFSLLSFDMQISIKNVNLGHFLAANSTMLRKKNEIRALVERAQGEIIIRESVENLKVWADKTEFNLLVQPTASSLGNTHIIREWKELFTQISDQQALVGSLKESPFFAPWADVAKQFEEKFVLLDDVLHALNLIQRKYLYLEVRTRRARAKHAAHATESERCVWGLWLRPHSFVFSSSLCLRCALPSLQPIFSRGALPSEQPRFKRIDSEFRGIMKEVAENPNVISITTIPDLRSTVHSMLEQLDRCQKALNDFLEEKRSKFPRFYFIGDDDLLEIIGQSENPLVIQNHLRKLFAGIATVEFSKDSKQIVAMRSSEKERVSLHAPVHITAEVEDWLANLSSSMESTLQRLLISALKEFNIEKYPSQILNLAEMIHFTSDCEQAIQKGNLPQLAQQLQARLKEYTGTDTSDEGDESALLQSKIKALVMDLIHNIDVVRQLSEAKVTSVDSWVWQKQLRFYLKGDLAVIRMVDAEFKYTYEVSSTKPTTRHTAKRAEAAGNGAEFA